MADYELFAWLDQENQQDHTGYFLGSLTTEQVTALGPSLLKAQQVHNVTVPLHGRAQFPRSSVRALVHIFEEEAGWQSDSDVRAALEAALSLLRVAIDLRVGIVWTTP